MSNIYYLSLGDDNPEDDILPYPTIKLSEEHSIDSEDLQEALVILGRFQRGAALSLSDIGTICQVAESIADAQAARMTPEQNDAVKRGIY